MRRQAQPRAVVVGEKEHPGLRVERLHHLLESRRHRLVEIERLAGFQRQGVERRQLLTPTCQPPLRIDIGVGGTDRPAKAHPRERRAEHAENDDAQHSRPRPARLIAVTGVLEQREGDADNCQQRRDDPQHHVKAAQQRRRGSPRDCGTCAAVVIRHGCGAHAGPGPAATRTSTTARPGRLRRAAPRPDAAGGQAPPASPSGGSSARTRPARCSRPSAEMAAMPPSIEMLRVGRARHMSGPLIRLIVRAGRLGTVYPQPPSAPMVCHRGRPGPIRRRRPCAALRGLPLALESLGPLAGPT